MPPRALRRRFPANAILAWCSESWCWAGVALGRGGAGKTVAARQIGELLHLPVIELDQLFWSAELTPTPPEQWSSLQAELAAAERWVMAGDLGPYDVPEARLVRADSIVILDFGLARCLWRAARRSRERPDFWRWVITWRHCARPVLLAAVADYALHADLHTVRTRRQLNRLLNSLRD